MSNSKSDFNVQFPVELFEFWIKQNGVEDGQMGENQEVLVSNITFDSGTGYINIDGTLETRLDS